MNNIQFHKAGINDLQLLIDSRIDFLKDYWGDQSKELEDNLREQLKLYFEKVVTAGDYICWYATIKNEFAGVGGIVIMQRPGSFRAPQGISGYIMNMYTVPKFRKQGIAGTILSKLMASGIEEHVQFFELHATKDGEPVYIKAGFAQHKEPTNRKFVEL
jgi:hypothetical protein